MLSAVLDTNIVVSANLRRDGRQALLLDLATKRRFDWFVSDDILGEYERTLGKTRFALGSDIVRQAIERIRESATLVTPRRLVSISPDSDDNKFLECALEANAQYVVTGNLRHFPARFETVQVVSSREFLTVLAIDMRTL